MPLGSELLDVTRDLRLRNPVIFGTGRRGTRPDPSPGVSNVRRFREAIEQFYPPGYSAATPSRVVGGILYLPPGRYLIENDLPPEWMVNLWESYHGADQLHRASLLTWKARRFDNPFGASLRFPPELTLWLAPDAVLVPVDGAIVDIQSALVCEPIQIFDPIDGGLIVFGKRVPRLLPQWWGVHPDEDHAPAIQAAIDAGIHNRNILWEGAERPDLEGSAYTSAHIPLPCIPVELRGDYHLQRPVEIRGTATQNRLLQILGRNTVQREPPSTTVRETIYVGIGERLAQTIPVVFGDPLAVATRVAVDPSTVATVTLSDDRRSITVEGRDVGMAWLTITRETSTERVQIQVEHPLHARREINPVIPNTMIEGVWHGRKRCGARLIAGHPFVEDESDDPTLGRTLLRLVGTFGLTMRNVAFEVGHTSGPTCLDIVPPNPPAPLQGIAVRGCSFTGGDATLVRLGPPPKILTPGSASSPPWAASSNYGSDISCIAFDECEFLPRSGGIGVMVRTSQSVPFRLRSCEFVGVARAMISAWEGTFLLDGCTFENAPPVTPGPPTVRGFEEPDGADIYLHFEPPWRGRLVNGVPTPYLTDTLPAFTAIGCVSRSPRFLSTANPFLEAGQRQEWPVLLMNVRHLPRPGPERLSVIWGMINATSSIIMSVDGRARARLGRGSPLVILGGQYDGVFRVLPGAGQSVILGARGVDTALMPPDLTVPRTGISHPTDIFGLTCDQGRWQR